MRVSLVLRSILAVLGKHFLQGIDVVQHGHRAFIAQQLRQFGVSRRRWRRNADKRHSRGPGDARASSTVSPRYQTLPCCDRRADLVQTLRMGFACET